MPSTRVLLVSPTEGADDALPARAARAMRDAGVEVVLLPDAPTAAIVAAATQEAVDTVYCTAARVAEVGAAIERAELDVVVTATEPAGRREP